MRPKSSSVNRPSAAQRPSSGTPSQNAPPAPAEQKASFGVACSVLLGAFLKSYLLCFHLITSVNPRLTLSSNARRVHRAHDLPNAQRGSCHHSAVSLRSHTLSGPNANKNLEASHPKPLNCAQRDRTAKRQISLQPLTIRIRDPAPKDINCQLKRHRRVLCIPLLGAALSCSGAFIFLNAALFVPILTSSIRNRPPFESAANPFLSNLAGHSQARDKRPHATPKTSCRPKSQTNSQRPTTKVSHRRLLAPPAKRN